MQIVQRVVVLLLLCSVSQTIFAATDTEEATTEQQDNRSSEEAHSAGESGITTKKASTRAGFPVLPSGKLGEHPDDSKGVKRTWEHKLPFLAQKVIDLGFDLPNPYGVAAIYTGVDQNMDLSDLRISLGPSENKTSIPFVTFEKSPIEVRSTLGKLDTWVWPFLNAFVTVGYVDGQGVVPIQVPVADALKVLAPNLGARCDDPPGAPLRPTACDEDFVLLDFPDFHGVTIGAGMLLSIGWRNYFVAVPLSYNFTDINTVDTTAEAFQGSMRIGGHFKPKHTEMMVDCRE